MMSLRTMTKPLALLAACALLYGCGGSGASDDPTTADGKLLFEPLIGAVPSPNDLAFQGSEDGTLNVTEVTPAGSSEPLDSQVSINSQDGFSTISSATAKFTVPVNGSTVTPGTTVRVFAVTTDGDPNGTADPGPKVVTGVARELTAGTDFTAGLSPADANGTTLSVTPLRPLDGDQTYMVVVTDGVEEQGGGALAASDQYQLAKSPQPLVDGNGASQVASLTDAQAQQLEGVRQLVGGVDVNADGSPDVGQIPVASAAGIAAADIIGSWTFTTQSIGDSLTAVRAAIRGDGTAAAFVDGAQTPNELTDTGVDTTPGANASIYAGVLAGLPYFLEPGGSDPTNVRTGFWAQDDGSPLNADNRVPAANGPETGGTVNVPVLVTIPDDDGAGAPYPVVVFQHGITSNRTALLGIADALAGAGMAAVAIDLPLHGLVFQQGDDPCAADPQSTECFLFSLWQEGNERHFAVDLLDNASLEAGPDGKIDASGSHFINLESLRTSRDNIRQAVSDLFAVTEAIEAVGAGGVDLDSEPQQVGGTQIPAASGSQSLDANNIRFLGHSLGGIVGGVFLANEPSVGAGVLANAGGGIAKLLDGSPALAGRIEAGLAENGLVKGLSGYEQFLGAAQTLVDSGDPLNYASDAVSGRSVLGLEVVGGSTAAPDSVVPNFVDPSYPGTPDSTIPSPTAGSSPLYGSPSALPGVDFTGSGMALTAIDASQGSAGDYLIQYVAGGHSSLLDPSTNADVTTEMQTNVTSFLANGGNMVSVPNADATVAPQP